MTPSNVSAVLRRIASRIDNSVNPVRSAVTRDLRRIIANMEMEAVFIGINFDPSQMSQEQAVETARTILSNAGYGSGEFQLIDEVRPGEIAGNLDIEAGFYGEMSEDETSFEAGLNGVTLSISF